MEKIRWRKILQLTIPLSIIAVITIVFVMSLGKVSKLSNGDFIGMRKTEFMDNKEVLLEKVITLELNEKNYDTFFFSDTNICIGHFQKAESKYFKDIYNKLIKRKGEPSGIKKDEKDNLDIIWWADGTELIYHEKEGLQVREIGKGFREYIEGLN